MSEEDVPEGWSRVALRDIGEVRLGRQRSPDRAEGPYMRPYMRAANVGWAGLRLDDVKEMDFRPDEFETYALRSGDILVGEASGSRDEVGKSSVWNDEVPGACFQNTLIRVRVDRSKAQPQFIQLHLQHDAQRGALAEIAKGIGIHHLGREGLAQWEVMLPRLDEQRRIVAKLDALRTRSRRAKDALDALPALLDRLRQSILAAAFRGDLTADWREQNPDVEPASELLKRIRIERRKRWEEAELARLTAKGKRPKDDGWKEKYVEPEPVDESQLPELPEGWCWASLSEIATLQLGQRRAPEFKHEAPYPYVRAANITWDGLDVSDIKTMGFENPASMFLEPGDVLLNEASGSPTEVGKPAVWNGEIARCCFQATVLRLRCVPSGASGGWLRLALLCDALLGRFVALAPGVGILHLTAERMRAWPVPLAPVGEQVALVARVEDGLARVKRLRTGQRESTQRMVALEAAILAAAFRGELLADQS